MSIQYTSDQLQRKFSGSPHSPSFARQADGLRLEGRLDEAIELCQNGLRVRPNQISGYLVLGKAFIDKDQLEKAREQFDLALKIDPRCLSALHFLAQILNSLHSGQLADDNYHRILELDPWDEEIKSLLADTYSSTYIKKSDLGPLLAPLSVPFNPSGISPDKLSPEEITLGSLTQSDSDTIVDAVYPHGETFEKPEGLTGDVMEISLNEPDTSDSSASSATSEVEPLDGLGILDAIPSDAMSLEDALGIQPAHEEAHLNEPPISGQDVTDRLDSIFGVDDDMPMVALTPAMSASQSIPVFVDFPKANDPEDAPTIQMKSIVSLAEAMDDDYDPAATVVQARTNMESDSIEELGTDSFNQLESQTQFLNVNTEAPEKVVETSTLEVSDPSLTETTVSATETNVLPIEIVQNQISGADVEKRLDDLFSLETNAEDDFSGEVVPRVEVKSEAQKEELDTDTDDLVLAKPMEDSVFEKSQEVVTETAIETEAQSEIEAEADALANATETHGIEVTEVPEELITGENLADHLDEFFGSDPETSTPIVEKSQEPVVSDFKGNILSTESMLPVTWNLDEEGEELEITGEDIEAQLDKLFAMVGESDEFDPAKVVIKAVSDVVTFEDLIPLPKIEVEPEAIQTQAIANPEAELTVQMPAFQNTANTANTANADLSNSSSTKETGAMETMYMATEEMEVGQNFNPGTQSQPALLLEEGTSLTDTTTIEMIDGEDVADRLDELFSIEEPFDTSKYGSTSSEVAGSEAAGIETMGFEIPTEAVPEILEAAETAGTETAESEAMVTGDEVALRLSEIFPETPISVVKDPPAPTVSMEDEEDGYPEEEMPQDGTGANVATVTLAEIYFQQGLKEQALKIYRQLLELEPGNETVKNRITEIEATKSEGDKGESEKNSSRNNRFGRKFPKRKK